MKRTALKMTFAAAAMLVTASMASAQSMKADIPFPFHAAGTRLQAGSYQVTVSRELSGTARLLVYSVDSRRGVMAMPYTWSASPAGANAVLTFLCSEGNCEMQKITNGSSTYYFTTHKAGEGARIATVLLRSDRAD